MTSDGVGPGQGGRLCGHTFCSSCWSLYLSHKIEEGETDRIVCPAVGCSFVVEAEFIEKMVTPEIAKKYLQFDIQAFVERNKTIKWCPWPGCGRAVKYPDAEEELPKTPYFGHDALDEPQKISHAVDCGKGHFFCWECLGEPHSPCSCDHWRAFQKKLADLKPEELKLSSMETEDAANTLWLVTNSKPCPNCRSPIQKTEGCNHMKCSKCKYVFCWVCLENWKKHSSATGGYFGCNRYTAQQKAHTEMADLISQARSKSEELQEMSKFLHCYSLYKKHQDFLVQEEPRLKQARTKMVQLAKNFSSLDDETKESRTVFVEESLKELVKSRRVIRGAVVYGHFNLENVYNKAVFYLILKELETATENLSKLVARDFLVTPKSKIIGTSLGLKKTRRSFLRAIARGVATSEIYGGDFACGLNGARRRVPTLIGLLPSEELKAFDRVGVRSLGQTSILGMTTCQGGPQSAPGPVSSTMSGEFQGPHSLWNMRPIGSMEEESSFNHALALTFLGKCNRKLCPRPKARNPHTGSVFGYCSLRCAQFLYQFADYPAADPGSVPLAGGDYSMDLLIALEMSRLQMIEDEARRRKSWLRERSRDHRFSGASYLGSNDGKIPYHSLPRDTSRSEMPGSLFHLGDPASLSAQFSDNKYQRHKSSNSSEKRTGSGSKNAKSADSGQALTSNDRCEKLMSAPKQSSPRARNRGGSKSNENASKNEKSMIDLSKKQIVKEDGRFRYGDLHENGHIFSFFALSSDSRRLLKRSVSAGDLTDKSSSDLEWILDSDHSQHQHFPEAQNRIRMAGLLIDKDSLETEAPSIEEDVDTKNCQKQPIETINCRKQQHFPLKLTKISSTDQNFKHQGNNISNKSTGVKNPKLGNIKNKLFACNFEDSSFNGKSFDRSGFKLSFKNEREKKFLNSKCYDETKSNRGKHPSLKIHVSSPSQLEYQSSNECESETGIPKSPTLYISGVSINRSPEPVSPKSETRPRSAVLNLPISNPENSSSTHSSKQRTRSKSMTHPKPSSASVSNAQENQQKPEPSKITSPKSIHLSSLSLKPPSQGLGEASDPRVSKSASEPEKGRLVFHFPKSPTEGTLSSVLHVKEDTLSSEDFHEALFINKSHRQHHYKSAKHLSNKSPKQTKKKK